MVIFCSICHGRSGVSHLTLLEFEGLKSSPFDIWSTKITEATFQSVHMARIFPRQWNLIKLKSISCFEIMRCSCAVGSVILPSSKPLAGLAVQLNYCTNGEVVKQYYVARNVLSLRQSLEWWKTSFGVFYSSICCLKIFYESDHFEKFALSGNSTRPLV